MNFMRGPNRNPNIPNRRKIGRPKKKRAEKVYESKPKMEVKPSWVEPEPVLIPEPAPKPKPRVSYKRDSIISVPVVHVALTNGKGIAAPFILSFYGIDAVDLWTTSTGEERIQSALNRHHLKGYKVSQIK